MNWSFLNKEAALKAGDQLEVVMSLCQDIYHHKLVVGVKNVRVKLPTAFINSVEAFFYFESFHWFVKAQLCNMAGIY